MRLVCPNCGARYEVPKESISATGRDVKCSACYITWFQTHPNAVDARGVSFDEGYNDRTQSSEAVLSEFRANPIEEEAGKRTLRDDVTLSESVAQGSHTFKNSKDDSARRRLHPTVTEILREEARREAKERAAETLNVQTKFGLKETTQFVTPKAGVAEHGKVMNAVLVDAMSQSETKASEEKLDERSDEKKSVIKRNPIIENKQGARSVKNELLQNVDDINPAIDSDIEAPVGDAGEEAPLVDVANKKAGRLGFFIGLFIIFGLFAIYQYEDRITVAFSPLVPTMKAYVSFVVRMRAYSDQSLYFAITWLEFQIERARQDETKE